ncbi:two-component system chemotaxis response regulator CheY [Chitinophaga skermanii]|uniref:Two-component system chemotaxis response regulator CheY n=1 Tax=Chitinophaga skermanii TaxID=331697 RepID=A0A327QQS3_9BACT|nr:response regulator [Chitinophaga skermanii]RAJ06946.1 two-component system chemotaxis response regulator CheY [Chitinophaga skermanii]
MKKTILVVDDSAPIRFLLESILGKQYKVFSAPDGLTAMMWLSKGNKPDLIITDIQMPNIDGWELVRYLSGNEMYDNIPVIVLSGAEEANAHNNSLEYKVAEYIRKPFDPMKLMESVNKCITLQPVITIAS